MPISVEYNWVDKKDSVKVLIPLKGVSANKTDIFVSSSTLKINFSPYLLDLVLYQSIDPIRHKASVKDGVLTVTLFKKVNEPWQRLEADGEAVQLLQRKKQALAEQASLDANMDSQRSDRKVTEEKHALRKQMKLEEMERTRMENLKQEEKDQAEKEVYDTFNQMQVQQQQVQKQAKPPAKSALKSSSFTKKSGVHFCNSPSAPNEDFTISSNKSSSNDIDDLLAAGDIDDEFRSSASPAIRDDDDEAADDVDNSSSSAAGDLVCVAAAEHDYCFVSTEEEPEMRYIPPPRTIHIAESKDGAQSSSSSNKVEINFTPRVFPTPMRESKAAEEEDWIAKNRKHLKKHGVLGKSLTKGNGVDVSEEDPVWLKAKGDDFLRSGDVRSALNAYSAALDADEKMISCFANRSICVLKLNLFQDCKADCTRGIQLIIEEIETSTLLKATAASTAATATVATVIPGTNPADSSAVHGVGKLGAMLIKLYLRRGAAACQLGQFTEAVSDYIQASTRYQQLQSSQLSALAAVDISLESITEDTKRLKLLSEIDRMKKDADSLFAEQGVEAALNQYSAALKILPVHVGCLSNRAACFMALNNLQGCIDDCSTALALLAQSPLATATAVDATASMLQYILPAAGSDKRILWTVKTLLRRGVALSQQNRLDAAVIDYQRACALEPTNESLKADLEKMIALRNNQQQQQGQQQQQVQQRTVEVTAVQQGSVQQ